MSEPGEAPRVLTLKQQRAKRALDLAASGIGLVATSPLTIVGIAVATIDTRQWGVFSQERVGLDGKMIRVHKVRSMRTGTATSTTVTTSADPRITSVGKIIRRLKIDELPQLVNVLKGDMSLVGPRPDVAGWADCLEGGDRVVLGVRPGITGPASIAFRHEETILASVDDPERYNREVIWPEKVRLNRQYVESWSLGSDLRWIGATIRSIFDRT